VLRRQAISTLLAAAAAPLAQFFDRDEGSAVLLDVAARRVVGSQGSPGRLLAPPGSTLKPLVLLALLRAGKIGRDESFACPGALEIGGRSFTCVHPPLDQAMRVPTALAYSCNCFVAHFAERFAPGELALQLERAGLRSRTGWFGDAEATGRIEAAAAGDASRLQALGEERVLVTPAGLAAAYRGLALNVGRSEMQPIVEGLEGAVDYGTAQRARVSNMRVAGKTGSARAADGSRVAWFAGFAPARVPQVVVAVMLQGRSGGGDAAPVAGRILEAWRAGKL
jgi:cell division protein FtsI/penicillin-binding protein 2